MVGVHVPGGHRAHAEGLRERAERSVPAGVAALVGALELDVEAVAAERAGEARRGVGIADAQAVPGAAREADEPLPLLLQQRLVEARVEPLVRVRGGQEAAEVRVPLRRLHQKRHVGAVGEGHLGPGDRPEAERLRRVGELERAVDAVVVGERERLVAELDRARGELLWQRGAVEERVRRVAVELDVFRHAHATLSSRSARHGCGSRLYARKRVVGRGAPRVNRGSR